MEKLLIVCGRESIDPALKTELSNYINIKSYSHRCIDNEIVFNVVDIICDLPELSPQIKAIFYENKLDFSLQNVNRKSKKLLLSDMDSTMVVGETIVDIAETLGIKPQIQEITDEAMLGNIGYEDSLIKRVKLLKGISKKTIMGLTDHINLTKGAKVLINEINKLKIDSCLVSGGFSLFTEIVIRELGMGSHLANELSFDDNDYLDGGIIGEIVSPNVKLKLLNKLAKNNNISLEETVAIGDGANDIPMLKSAGLGVSFQGKPAVRKIMNSEINYGGIDTLLWFL